MPVSPLSLSVCSKSLRRTDSHGVDLECIQTGLDRRIVFQNAAHLGFVGRFKDGHAEGARRAPSPGQKSEPCRRKFFVGVRHMLLHERLFVRRHIHRKSRPRSESISQKNVVCS